MEFAYIIKCKLIVEAENRPKTGMNLQIRPREDDHEL